MSSSKKPEKHAKDAPKRHPASDPKETMQKEFIFHCQNSSCWRVRGENEKFFRCGGCSVGTSAVLYCSKECQRQAWPVHKHECKKNQEIAAKMPVAQIEQRNRLQGFVDKHGPTIATAGFHALELSKSIDRSMLFYFEISTKPRPGPARLETSFLVTDVIAELMDRCDAAADMRATVQQQVHLKKHLDVVCAFIVVVQCEEYDVSVSFPICISTSSLKSMPDPDVQWKHVMMEVMNRGIVL